MPSTSFSSKSKKEARLKRWRSKCPQKVAERIGRANTEKMYVLEQDDLWCRSTEEGCNLKIAGSTGNVYDVSIGKLPSCSCPDHMKREDACKHTLFVLLKIVGLKTDDELLYQKAFTTSELYSLLEKMVSNKKKASKYYFSKQDDDYAVGNLIRDFSQTNIEEGGGVYMYDNIRHLTGQSPVRDTSTYRPFHTERRSNGGYYGRHHSSGRW